MLQKVQLAQIWFFKKGKPSSRAVMGEFEATLFRFATEMHFPLFVCVAETTDLCLSLANMVNDLPQRFVWQSKGIKISSRSFELEML